MRFAASVTALAGVSSAAILPLSNGFPKLSGKAVATVEKHAGGTLPNTPLPKKLSDAAIETFKLVGAQETFEVTFFTHILHNINMKKPGFTFNDATTQEEVRAALFRIRAQEELHAYGAAAILAGAGATPPKPCKFKFTPTSFEEAIALANTFTDVVLGVLPTVQALAAADGGEEAGLIPLLGSILGQEAEQNGYYRVIGKKKPSAAPFITGGDGSFAFSALRGFIVPGSCPAIENLPIPYFDPITIANPPTTAADTVLQMSVPGAVPAGSKVTYLSGQNLPVSVAITNLQSASGGSTFSAALPFTSKGFAKGLTIAAVTKPGKFATPADVAGATLFGPGLIEVL